MRQQEIKRPRTSLPLLRLNRQIKSHSERRLENEFGSNDYMDIDSYSRCDTAWMDWLGDRG